MPAPLLTGQDWGVFPGRAGHTHTSSSLPRCLLARARLWSEVRLRCAVPAQASRCGPPGTRRLLTLRPAALLLRCTWTHDMWVRGCLPRVRSSVRGSHPRTGLKGASLKSGWAPPGPPARGPASSGPRDAAGAALPRSRGHSSPVVLPESWCSRCSGNPRVRLQWARVPQRGVQALSPAPVNLGQGLCGNN